MITGAHVILSNTNPEADRFEGDQKTRCDLHLSRQNCLFPEFLSGHSLKYSVPSPIVCHQ
jgi:hypothetical protein